MTSKQIQFLFEIRNQIKLYHWQTYQHARHIATDKYLESLDKHIDYFVEVSMGKYGRPRVTTATATITLKNMTEKMAAAYLNAARSYLQGTFSMTINPKDTDLLNIRDEILANLNQFTYLLTFK